MKWGCNIIFFYSTTFKLRCDIITPADEINNIISHKKFLHIPINPPIFDIKLFESIFQDDLVMSTSLSKVIVMPVILFLFPFKPIAFAWYFFVLHWTPSWIAFT